jgi:hypothetical protein
MVPMIDSPNRKFFRAVFFVAAVVALTTTASICEETRFLTLAPDTFTLKVPVVIYNRTTLYELIDGEAMYYLSYGFDRLEHGIYQKGKGTYTVDIYELGSPLSAFGAYRQQREADAASYPVGTEGAMIEYLTTFFKDRYYVEIVPQSSGDDDVGAMKLLAGWVDGLLSGSKELPAEVSLFPTEGLVTGSERYVDESLISYSFMGRGLTASYKDPGQDKEVKVFIAFSPAPDSAKAILDGFRSKLTNTVPVTIGGAEGVRGELPYRGVSLACVSGTNVFGCMGVTDEKAATARLAALAGRLKAFGK